MADSNIDYWEVANILRGEAEYQDFKYGSSNYEWEMGVEAYETFLESIIYTTNEVGAYEVLMGIPIRKNVQNPECLKLWREVRI